MNATIIRSFDKSRCCIRKKFENDVLVSSLNNNSTIWKMYIFNVMYWDMKCIFIHSFDNSRCIKIKFEKDVLVPSFNKNLKIWNMYILYCYVLGHVVWCCTIKKFEKIVLVLSFNNNLTIWNKYILYYYVLIHQVYFQSYRPSPESELKYRERHDHSLFR